MGSSKAQYCRAQSFAGAAAADKRLLLTVREATQCVKPPLMGIGKQGYTILRRAKNFTQAHATVCAQCHLVSIHL